MRVLLSSYACEPGGGSETGKGWNFALELARQGVEVTVLTCGSHHRAAIERHRENTPLPPGLSFAWHDVPRWPGPGYANARYIRQHYLAWQMTARSAARRLHAQNPYDVIHHHTWTVLRWPSFLGGLGPRFVFGPVGGGQGSPQALREGLPRSGRRREELRDAINLVSRVDPMVLYSLWRADAILVTDKATLRQVPRRWHDKATVVADIYAPDVVPTQRSPAHRGPALLFVGRLEFWKGAQLAIGALGLLRHDAPAAMLTIAGAGPDEGFLRARVAELGLEGAVIFTGHVPFEMMHGVYANHDLFLFPSLHDSGPHVVGEALAHGLPVVCLDLGGPGEAVGDSCGAVIQTGAATREQVERSLADAVLRIASDPARLVRLSNGARQAAEHFRVESRVREMVERFYTSPHP